MLITNIVSIKKRVIIAIVIALIVLLIPVGAYAENDTETESLPESISNDSSQDTRKSSNDETSTDFKTDSSGQSGSTNFFEEPQLIKPDDSFSPADIETTISQGQDKPVNVTTTETPPLITEPPDTDNTSEHNIFSNSTDTIENDRDTANTSDVADCEDISSEPKDDSVMVETTDEVLAVNIEDTETAPVDPVGGNSYRAEINIDPQGVLDPSGPPHATPDQDVDVKITFTELGADTPLGSAQVFLDGDFNYTDYVSGVSAGLTINSSQGSGAASRWTAVWHDDGADKSILLAADYIDDDDNGYLAQNEWVSVIFKATAPELIAPAVESEHTFTTAAWTDDTYTTSNNMHADYRDPTIVVSNQVSYRIIENIITAVELQQILENGDTVAVPDPMPHPEEDLLDLEIEYNFILPEGHQYNEGAFYELVLPQEFAVYNDVNGDLLDNNGVKFGTFHLATDRTARLTFNDEIHDDTVPTQPALIGYVQFQTEVRADLDGDLRRDLEFDIRESALVRIPLNFAARPGTSIDKSGLPNRPYNTESIDWTVDFNKDLQPTNNAILHDPLGPGLALAPELPPGNPGNIELYLLRVQIDGSVIQEAAVPADDYLIVTSSDDPDVTGFEIRFLNPINDAYRLVFATDVIDPDGTAYTNTATLRGDGIDPLTAAATVAVERGAVLEKDVNSFNQDLNTVDWEIRINYNLKEIPTDESTVTDIYGSEQVLLGLPQVWLVTLDDNGVEILSDPPGPLAQLQVMGADYIFNDLLDPDDPASIIGFTIQFIATDFEDYGEGPIGIINNAYRINYQTEPADRVYGPVALTNTAQFRGETAGASQTLTQSILSKIRQNVDYENETVEWVININRDEHEMRDLEITDTFVNGGLTVTPADLNTAVTVTGLPVGVTYDITPNLGGDGFIIGNFRDASNNPTSILDPLTITYTTFFAYEDLSVPANNFRDRVRLDWTDVNNIPHDFSVTRTFTPNLPTRQNGFKGGSYNALEKTITWEVGVNYNRMVINGASVEDYILGNQTLMFDITGDPLIAVYNATINPDGSVTRGAPLVQGSDPGQYQLDITITGPDPETNPGFEITLGDINSFYIIEYQTSLVDTVIAGQYDNTAYLYSGAVLDTQLNATVSNQNWGVYTRKSGINDGRTVTWQIDVNPGLSLLENVIITDQLSPGQLILQDSIEVYSTTVTNAGGSYDRNTPPLTRDFDYTVVFSGDLNSGEEMVVNLLIPPGGTINSAYIIEFQTYIEFIYQGEVSNQAVLTASTSGLPDNTGDFEDIGGRITSGQGGIGGFLGRLIVRKASVDTGELLPGAQFELRHSSGDTIIATATSGSNGTVTFNNILFGDYTVAEVGAPDGYQIDTTAPQAINIGSRSTTITFNNTKIPDPADPVDPVDPGGPGGPGGPGLPGGLGGGWDDPWAAVMASALAVEEQETQAVASLVASDLRELPRTGISNYELLIVLSGLLLLLTGALTGYKSKYNK